jgi:large subunit ribosomal protein L4
MPTVDVLNVKKEKVGTVELRDEIFAVPVRKHLLHTAVVWQLEKRRQGTRKTKGRSEVSGGGKKPWRQKGTGRARQGSTRAPQWRHGGIVFGPLPYEYDPRLPRRVRRAALAAALSSKVKNGQLIVLDQFALSNPKTKEAASVLNTLAAPKALIVTGNEDTALERAARNLPTAKVLRSEGLNVYDVLRYSHLILTRDAIDNIHKGFGA